MPTVSLRTALLPALLATALTTGVLATPAAAAPAADPQATAAAAAYLAAHLSPTGTVTGSFEDDKGNTTTFTNWGQSLDAALALLAAGGQDATLGRALTSVEDSKAVAEYTQGAPGDKADAAYVGATAKLAFVVAATGGDASKVGGVDLLAQLLSLQSADSRFADRSSFGNYANLFGHAFALLALKQSGRTPADAAVQALLATQCADGSFPEDYPKAGTACTGSVDATGLVLQALAALGQGGAQPANAAATWLKGQQKADGSFPGQAPVNSTGYAVLGLDAVNAPIGNALTYLTSQQNADGGLRTGAAAASSSDLFATAQTLPALAGKTFTASSRTVMRQATLTMLNTRIVATGASSVTVQAPPNSVVDLFAYSRPSTTFSVVRTATVGATGVVTWSVSPLTNTRLYAQSRGGAASPQTVLNVATALSLSAARTGTRTYVFSGRSIPARTGGLIVSLYRRAGVGGSVLTAQARADAKTGMWSLTRTFSGTGTFDFTVQTGNDLQNVAGSSNSRTIRIW
ncbi:MAG: terpene cyclase/mutase family protein [Frankiaceae bacterium]|nr:terpene cyclase/mutase family protein [Frankiaceae bacterium]